MNKILTILLVTLIANNLSAQGTDLFWDDPAQRENYVSRYMEQLDSFVLHVINIDKNIVSAKFIINNDEETELTTNFDDTPYNPDRSFIKLKIGEHIVEEGIKDKLDPKQTNTIDIVIIDEDDTEGKFTLTINADKSLTDRNNNQDDNSQSALIAQHITKNYGAFASRFFDNKNNLILVGKTVHVFLDEYGNTYFSSFPTTSREDYNYQFHVFYLPEVEDEESKNFVLEYTGSYEPTFGIYGQDNLSSASFSSASANKDQQETVNEVQERIFGRIGPFTNSFTVTIKERFGDNDPIDVISKTIKVAPVHHISVTASLLRTSLQNPTDLEKKHLSGADSTVIANDPNDRGLVSLMATFYPKPRNLLFSPTSWQERVGFVVGTRIDQDYSENFLLGLSFDLARGAALTGGIHYGRVNRLQGIDNDDFEFGKDVFVGEIQSKKEWDIGFFIGANIDLRVFGLLFNPQGQTN